MPKKSTSKSEYIKLFLGALEDTFQFKRLIPYWLPVWAWMAFIFYVSSRPQIGIGFWGMDYLWHLGAFAILAFFIYRAFRSYQFSFFDSFILGSVSSFLYAIFDEIHQIFVPGRSFSLLDILIDTAGILLLGLAAFIMSGRRKDKTY